MIYKNLKIVLEDRIIENGYIEISGEKIVDIKIGDYDGDAIDCNGLTAIPGFIEQHMHGSNGADFMFGTKNAVEKILERSPEEGITSIVATTMTMDKSYIYKAFESINYHINNNSRGKTEILGIHVEGPFISSEYKGAHEPKYMINLLPETFDEFQEKAEGNITFLTYAPELDQGYKFTDHLLKKGITLSVGHSGARASIVKEVLDKGVKCLTHFYNAMSPHHHRNPGVVSSGLMYDDLYCELIVDGYHVTPEVIKTTYKIKGADKIILITDAMCAKWMNDGQEFELGGYKVSVKDGKAKLDNGIIAGSTLKFIDAYKNMIEFTGCSLIEASKMASINPAKMNKVSDRKGSISVGKDADILFINDNLDIVTTICRGEIAYQK